MPAGTLAGVVVQPATSAPARAIVRSASGVRREKPLKAKAIHPYWCVHHGITVSMYYADPDGNQM